MFDSDSRKSLCSLHPFGAVPHSAALFPGGMEVTAWAVGTLVNSEGTQGHFWTVGMVPVFEAHWRQGVTLGCTKQ